MHGVFAGAMDEALFDRLLRGLFDFSPVPICISTTGLDASTYLKVNDAYLKLVGRSWAELHDARLTTAGVAISDERRRRRQDLLATIGHYELEEVEINHASGALLSTLISAQRFVADGRAYDIEVIIDVTARKAAETALWHLAHFDGLTGVANRSYFIERLDEAAAACRRDGGALALALIDLDFFKLINDRHGHMAGDRALTDAARRIGEAIGEAGLVGRLGGDEFAVLLNDAGDREAARAAIEAIGAALNGGAQPLLHPEARPTVTIGYALLPDHAADADALMRAADIALYRGKGRGRAVAVPFEEAFSEQPDGAWL